MNAPKKITAVEKVDAENLSRDKKTKYPAVFCLVNPEPKQISQCIKDAISFAQISRTDCESLFFSLQSSFSIDDWNSFIIN